jgi:hypothetical protein
LKLKAKVYKTQNTACAPAQPVTTGWFFSNTSEGENGPECYKKEPQVRYRTTRTSLMRLSMERIKNQVGRTPKQWYANVSCLVSDAGFLGH